MGEPEFTSTAHPEGLFSKYVSTYADTARADLEKFIGENLISKIGIVVLVLGVGIGAKYAIDNNWISPLARIIIGYIFGFGLVGLAIKLKPKYLNFSSVLISGGMAIMYFVTFFAYSAYGLIGQFSAFALMVLFTVFTVAAALFYNRQVIAHIGLVGAYAVPFLLSDDSGRYLVLFAYMAIINAGILAISVKKYWKPIFYTASGFTWLIFFAWFVTKYSPSEHFYLALSFLGIFFATFYATKVIQGVLHKESSENENLLAIIATGFIFYAFCFGISDVRADVREYTAIFSYLAAFSLAILITSYRFYGRVLVYLAYPFTWIIFGGWLATKYRADEHFLLAAVFASVFFAIFYGATIIYRLLATEDRMVETSGLLLTNSFIFYGVGYGLMESREGLQGFQGIFTLAHAIMHFAVAQIVSRVRAAAVDVVQVLTILIVTFATIAVPVQLDGSFVTLAWSVEAALLFWFGRAKQVPLFEYFSYPLMLLAVGSLFVDWAVAYADRTNHLSIFNRQPMANGDLITALVLIAAFSFIYVTNREEKFEPAIDGLVRPFGLALAAVGVFILYNAFRIEIGNYFHILQVTYVPTESLMATQQNADLRNFNLIWQINYTLFFLIAMCVVNVRKFASRKMAYVNVALGASVLFFFSTVNIVLFDVLRQRYMAAAYEPLFTPRWMYVGIRYMSYPFAAGMLYVLYRYSGSEFLADRFPRQVRIVAFDALLTLFILIVASGELINLMGQYHIPDAYKLGLSVLWGVYALVLIVLGIAWQKKHLRIGAFVLLGVTLAKLFLYDVADLETIPKTILFVTLGITMLVVSFLYNKYKSVIFPLAANNEE